MLMTLAKLRLIYYLTTLSFRYSYRRTSFFRLILSLEVDGNTFLFCGNLNCSILPILTFGDILLLKNAFLLDWEEEFPVDWICCSFWLLSVTELLGRVMPDLLAGVTTPETFFWTILYPEGLLGLSEAVLDCLKMSEMDLLIQN
jgi:hypothetical protein